MLLTAAGAGACVAVGCDRTAVGVGALLIVTVGCQGIRGAHRQRSARLDTAAVSATMVALSLAVLAMSIALVVSLGLVGTVREVLRPTSSHALVAYRDHIAGTWTALVETLVGCAVVGWLVASKMLRRPRTADRCPDQADLTRAAAIVAEHGRDSLSPFVLRPDKAFAFAGDGMIAFRQVVDTAIASGDPVGPEDAIGELVQGLIARAHEAGVEVAFYGASERHLECYRSLGLRTLCVGEEAVVDPARFSLDGRPVRKLRQSVNRVTRRGWRIEALDGRAITRDLEREIDVVEARWRSQHPRLLGFAMSMGAHDPGVRPGDLYLLGRAPDGELRAVMRLLGHRGNLSLDTMRRVGETPNGLNEALICEALRYARSHELGEVSLNYAGLGHLVHTGSNGRLLISGPRRLAVAPLRHHFQMDRLVTFCEKFSPEWRPRYLVYESRATLPRTVVRVLQAEGYLPLRERPVSPDALADASGWFRALGQRFGR